MKDLRSKAAVLSFLKSHVLATISTANNTTLQPESALVAYAELDNFEILFLTLEGSRKWVNLQSNSKVAMVVGWESNPARWATLQYEGQAYPVSDIDESHFRTIFLHKKGSPCTEEFFKQPHMRLFKISPTWIGFSCFPPGEKPRIVEIKSF